MQTYAKPKRPAFEDELETEPPSPASNPTPKPHRASNGSLPENWADTPESIDHAADILGMKRMPFEEDDALSQRITARLALG